MGRGHGCGIGNGLGFGRGLKDVRMTAARPRLERTRVCTQVQSGPFCGLWLLHLAQAG